MYMQHIYIRLLCLLHALLSRCAVQPHSDECQPSSDCDPDTTNPDPGTADLPTPWPLVVGKMPDCDLPLFIDVRDERSAIVDTEVEDAVLIGGLEGSAEDGGVCGTRDGGEVEAVEGRQHAELKLDVVVRIGNEGSQVVVGPL